MFGNNRSLEKRLREGGGKTAKALITDAKKGLWVSSSGCGEAASASPSTGEPASHPAVSVAGELEKLAALRDRGVLTEAEFETQKKLLGL